MNELRLVGRLARTPELRYTPSGKAYTNFSVACGYGRKNESGEYENAVDFVPCIMWGKRAEALAKCFHKGSGIVVSGKVISGSYDKEGKKVYFTRVHAFQFEFPPCPSDKSKDAAEQPPLPNKGNEFIGDDYEIGGELDLTEGDEAEIPF